MPYVAQFLGYIPIYEEGALISAVDWFYHSPPQNQRFPLANVSWLLDTRKDKIENKVSTYFLVCKGLSIDGVGVSRDTVF